MGANQSFAENVADQSVKVQNSVVQNYINSCGVAVNGNVSFIDKNCGGYVVNDVNIYNDILFDQVCIQKIASNSQMNNDIEQTATLTAESLSKGIGLNEADSKNFLSQSVQLSNKIQQNFTNDCAAKLSLQTTFDCEGGGNFTVSNITIHNNVNDAVVCDQALTVQTTEYNTVKQIAALSASAKSIGPSFDAALIFFIVLAIAACFIMFYGEQFLIYLIIILVIVAILAVIGYIIYAKAEGKIPFQKDG